MLTGTDRDGRYTTQTGFPPSEQLVLYETGEFLPNRKLQTWFQLGPSPPPTEDIRRSRRISVELWRLSSS